MSLSINQPLVFEKEVLTDLVSRLDCLLFNKLLGVPVLHYRLWKASRDGGVEQFLIADHIPHSIKQQAISRFEMAWEQIETGRTSHQDLVLSRTTALAFVQAQKQCDKDQAEVILKRYTVTALQSRKWMLNRVAELISDEDSHIRTIGQGLLNTINQFAGSFNDSLDREQFHIQMNYLPQERVRLTGCGDLSHTNTYDISTITMLLGCFMHGVSIGFVSEKYAFIDYERLIIPAMRIIDKSCFDAPQRLNLPMTVTLTSQYGIEISYKPKSHREALRPQHKNYKPALQPRPS